MNTPQTTPTLTAPSASARVGEPPLDRELGLAALTDWFWEVLTERLDDTAPVCPSLFADLQGHRLELDMVWNSVDGALTGTLACLDCEAMATWSLQTVLGGEENVRRARGRTAPEIRWPRRRR